MTQKAERDFLLFDYLHMQEAVVTKIGSVVINLQSSQELLMVSEKQEKRPFQTLPINIFGELHNLGNCITIVIISYI